MFRRAGHIVDGTFRDLRHGLRMLAQRPLFAAAAVLTLGIGAGGGTAVFSVIRAVLLSPLPYRDSDRLVSVYEQNLGARIARSAASDANYADWKRLNQCFSAMAAYDSWVSTTISADDRELWA